MPAAKPRMPSFYCKVHTTGPFEPDPWEYTSRCSAAFCPKHTAFIAGSLTKLHIKCSYRCGISQCLRTGRVDSCVLYSAECRSLHSAPLLPLPSHWRDTTTHPHTSSSLSLSSCHLENPQLPQWGEFDVQDGIPAVRGRAFYFRTPAVWPGPTRQKRNM